MADSRTQARSLEGKRGLVVGASGGIGRQVALGMAEAGAWLAIHGGRDERRARSCARELQERGARVTSTWGTIERAEDVLRWAESVLPVDILVVAFGPIQWLTLESTGVEAWRSMTELNLTVPGALVTACLPGMAERGFGRIVLFGAGRGDTLKAYREIPAYASAKIGLGVLAKSVAAEYASAGVACNVVCPGYVETEYMTDRQKRVFSGRTPRKRLTPSAEIAEVALWLCDTGPNVVNGAVINAGDGLT